METLRVGQTIPVKCGPSTVHGTVTEVRYLTVCVALFGETEPVEFSAITGETREETNYRLPRGAA